METTIRNINELDTFAVSELQQINKLAASAQGARAMLVGLSGELGAGKTAFVKALGRALGVADSIPSPTFVIARFYEIPKHQYFSRLVHVDAYRIEDEEELRPLGWEKMLSDPKNLIVAEWPEKIAGSMSGVARTLNFAVVDETTRIIRA